jgi:hypothetical protein
VSRMHSMPSKRDYELVSRTAEWNTVLSWKREDR